MNHCISSTEISCFLKLAKVLNFSKAAKELYISQPALSKHIQSFETKLGYSLFHRDTHTVSLTDSGYLLYERLLPLVASMYEAAEEARTPGGKHTITLKIGVSDLFLSLTALRSYKQHFAALFPDVLIHLQVLPADDILVHYKKGNFDYLFLSEYELFSYPNAHVLKLAHLPAMITYSKKHPAFSKSSVQKELFADTQFAALHHENYPAWKSAFIDTVRVNNLISPDHPPRIYSFSTSEDLLDAVRNSSMATILPPQPDAPDLKQLPLRISGFQYDSYMIWSTPSRIPDPVHEQWLAGLVPFFNADE